MAAVEGLAADVDGALAPGREDVEVFLYDAAPAPEREEWDFDPTLEVGLVMGEVDRGGGAVVLAGGMDGGGVAEAAQIFGQGLRSVDVAPAAPALQRAREVVVGIGADQALRESNGWIRKNQ